MRTALDAQQCISVLNECTLGKEPLMCRWEKKFGDGTIAATPIQDSIRKQQGYLNDAPPKRAPPPSSSRRVEAVRERSPIRRDNRRDTRDSRGGRVRSRSPVRRGARDEYSRNDRSRRE